MLNLQGIETYKRNFEPGKANSTSRSTVANVPSNLDQWVKLAKQDSLAMGWVIATLEGALETVAKARHDGKVCQLDDLIKEKGAKEYSKGAVEKLGQSIIDGLMALIIKDTSKVGLLVSIQPLVKAQLDKLAALQPTKDEAGKTVKVSAEEIRPISEALQELRARMIEEGADVEEVEEGEDKAA